MTFRAVNGCISAQPCNCRFAPHFLSFSILQGNQTSFSCSFISTSAATNILSAWDIFCPHFSFGKLFSYPSSFNYHSLRNISQISKTRFVVVVCFLYLQSNPGPHACLAGCVMLNYVPTPRLGHIILYSWNNGCFILHFFFQMLFKL